MATTSLKTIIKSLPELATNKNEAGSAVDTALGDAVTLMALDVSNLSVQLSALSAAGFALPSLSLLATKKEVASINTKVNKAVADIKVQALNIVSLSSQLIDHKSAVLDITTKVGDNDTATTQVLLNTHARLNLLTASVSALSAQSYSPTTVPTLSSPPLSANPTIVSITNKLWNLDTQVANLNKTVSDLATTVSTGNSTLSALSATVKNTSTTQLQIATQLQSDLVSLNTRLSNDAMNRGSEVTRIDASISGLRGDVNGLLANSTAVLTLTSAQVSMGGIMEIRSISGTSRYINLPINTEASRSKLLTAALRGAQSDDTVILRTGSFVIQPGTRLLELIPAGVTNVTILTEGSATYRYANPFDNTGDGALFPAPHNVSTELEFRAAIRTNQEKDVCLIRPITLTEPEYFIPRGICLTAQPRCCLIQGGNSLVKVYGEIGVGRRCIFSKFQIGEVRGLFRNGEVYPEWWGFMLRTGSDPFNPDNMNDLDDDRPLNSAAHSCAIWPGTGVRQFANVSVAQGELFISRPIDGNNSSATILFNKSRVTTHKNFKFLRRPIQLNGVAGPEISSLLDCEQWPEVPGGNHGIVITIGGDYNHGTQNTFRCQIKDVWLDTYWATFNNWGIHVSGISSIHGVEEQTVIDSPMISNYSGFGIGFARNSPLHNIPRAQREPQFPYPSTVNGLTIHNFDITGPSKRDAVPICMGKWTYQCSINKGTINSSVLKAVSRLHASPLNSRPTELPGYAIPSSGATPDPRTDSQKSFGNGPETYTTYPDYAMILQGNVHASNIHIEGATIGVYIKSGNGAANTVTIDNVDGIHLSDRARDAVYSLDGHTGMDLTTDPTNPQGKTRSNMIPQGPGAWNGYSSLILIDNEGYGNYKDCVKVSNIHISGGCTFLIRDQTYGIHLRGYGSGQVPDSWDGSVALYARGNAYFRTRDNNPNQPGGAYAPISPQMVYTLGPQDPKSDIIPPDPNVPGNFSRKFFELIY